MKISGDIDLSVEITLHNSEAKALRLLCEHSEKFAGFLVEKFGPDALVNEDTTALEISDALLDMATTLTRFEEAVSAAQSALGMTRKRYLGNGKAS